MNGEVRVVDDVPAAFVETVRQCFEQRTDPDRFSIALSGGSTAPVCYEQLAKEDIDWGVVTALWGDERCVDLDHDDSNYKLAKTALFDRVSRLAAVHPMDCRLGADAYEKIVASLTPIDVVHLGMGEDGHTASLFPGSPLDHDDLVAMTGDDLHKHPRMTLTLEAIARSRVALFTVAGTGKREMFERIKNDEPFPASLVTAGRVIWLVGSEVVS